MKTLETCRGEPTVQVVVNLPISLRDFALEQQVALRVEALGYEDFHQYILQAIHAVSEADQFFRTSNLPENGGNRVERSIEKGSL
jgi:hypothetical protein